MGIDVVPAKRNQQRIVKFGKGQAWRNCEDTINTRLPDPGDIDKK